jgi:GNAT superfamily N-acetyltransferase
MAAIEAVSYRRIIEDPRWEKLSAEYEAECALPELGPVCIRHDLYEAMERNGATQAFGVYEDEILICFMNVRVWVVLRYGKKIATTESIFLADAYRSKGIWPKMMAVLKSYAKSKGCVTVQCTAPVGSRFARLMDLNAGQCRRTNNVYLWSL